MELWEIFMMPECKPWQTRSQFTCKLTEEPAGRNVSTKYQGRYLCSEVQPEDNSTVFFILIFLFFLNFIFLYSRFLLVIYFIHISVYMSIPISQFIPPPPTLYFPPSCPCLFSTSVSLWLANWFICTIFLDFTCVNIWYLFFSFWLHYHSL